MIFSEQKTELKNRQRHNRKIEPTKFKRYAHGKDSKTEIF